MKISVTHSKIRILVYITLLCLALALSDSEQVYHSTVGRLCIQRDFVQTVSKVYCKIGCAALCSRNQRCQAFTVADGPCQLFVFDKCSKSVRDCSCSRRGQVFVKRQPGLEAGALCPSGYGDDLCGVKYKLHSGFGAWWPSRQKCESESGLVIMADVLDATEIMHVETIYSNYSVGKSFWLGGLQPAGSPEPAGGWFWVGCNITLDGSLWGSGEPSNEQNNANVVGRWDSLAYLNDFMETDGSVNSVLCECLSLFE